jgi:hypothetical protein
MNEMSQDAIILEIKNQISQCDIRLKKEHFVSDYVKILSEKRQLEELLKQEQTKKNTDG